MTKPIVNITFWMESFHDNSMETCFNQKETKQAGII